MVLSDWKFGTFFSVNFSWGTGVMLGCYWGGGVSGEYLAVSLQRFFVLVLCCTSGEGGSWWGEQ